MSRNATLAIVAVLVVIVGGWILMRPKQTAIPETVQPAQTPTSTESATPLATDGAKMTAESLITITKAGFSPKDITISQGAAVTWMNSDTADHTVNSAPHPTHTIYPPLNLDTIKPGEKQSLVFPKAGTYKYHDHLNPSLFGAVTVQ